MSQINVNNLTFAYDGSADNIFENVSFKIDTDWKLGFIGRNGKGKTTFLNLLLGKYEYSGQISSTVEFEYFPFEISDKSEYTVDIVNSVCPCYQDWQLFRELNLLEVDAQALYRPFDTLSYGEQTKIMLAAAFLKENSFLLIDEPTNHLDTLGRDTVSRWLNSKSGFILVSHDRAVLDACTDHILSINKNSISVESGNFSSWLAGKERRDKFEISENEKLKKEVKRLKKAADEQARRSNKAESEKFGNGPVDRGYIGHKSAKMMKRSKAISRRRDISAEEKSKLMKDVESAESLKLSQLTYHNTRLVALEKVGINYGETSVCENVSFTIEKGDRISLVGKNGSGKSSIIKLICGKNDAYMSYHGTLLIGAGLKISYVSQDTSYLKGSLTDFAYQHDIDESLFKAVLRKMGFERAQFSKNIEDFSAGQKKKALIAKSLCEKSHLLIWDEPLNYIDVISRIQIENLLLDYNPTILFVEHDSTFCEKIASKTVKL